MNEDQEIIFPESVRAASLMTVTGWVSRLGHFFGDDHKMSEELARYDGSTHKKCSCGAIIERNGYCQNCHALREVDKYRAMEKRPWNGTDALYSQSQDRYFFDADELQEFCEDREVTEESLMLVICVPTYAGEIDPNEYYYDDLPEDGEVPEVVAEAFKELNERLREAKAILGWYPGKYAVMDDGRVVRAGK